METKNLLINLITFELFVVKYCLNAMQNCNKWVLCRVHEMKETSSDQQTLCYEDDDDDNGTELSCLDEMFLQLDDDLEETSLQTN